MKQFKMLCVSIAFACGVVSAQAERALVTVSTLLREGGVVLNVVPTQEWPYFYILTTDKRFYICGMDFDSAGKFFDYRQPTPDAVQSRCSEVR